MRARIIRDVALGLCASFRSQASGLLALWAYGDSRGIVGFLLDYLRKLRDRSVQSGGFARLGPS